MQGRAFIYMLSAMSKFIIALHYKVRVACVRRRHGLTGPMPDAMV
jgi:hypothetical protein